MTSFAEWHLIQFTPDMRRREPRNIGVAATDGTAWQLRLFGVDADTSAVDGRSLRKLQLNRDDYVRWVAYYQTLITDGQIDRIRQSQRRRPAEFRLITGGQTELRADLGDFVQNLYEEMVQDEKPSVESPTKTLQFKVEQVLNVAQIAPSPEISVVGLWGDREDDIPFNYGYTNGKLHLMDRLQLHQSGIEHSKMVARDFNARANAARDAGSADSFVAFYSQSVVDELGSDSVLAPLWQVAEIFDVDDTTRAAEDLLHYIHA